MDWEPIAADALSPSVLLASFHICPVPYDAVIRNPGLNIYLIMEGRMRFTTSDGACGVASSHDLVTFYSGLNHYSVISKRPLAIYQVVLSPAPPPLDRGVPYLPGIGRLPHVVRLGDRAGACVAALERAMQALLRLAATWRLDAAAAALELISLAFRSAQPGDAEPFVPIDRWQRLLALLDREDSRLMTIGELASEMGMCPDHFIRHFRRITGRTPKQYILLRHLWNARRLMAQGKSVKEAAFQCGFTNPAYFSRLYKSHFQHAPTHVDRVTESDASPPPLLIGVTPNCRHLIAPGVNPSIFCPKNRRRSSPSASWRAAKPECGT